MALIVNLQKALIVKPLENVEHAKCTLQESTFSALSTIPSSTANASSIWATLATQPALPWGSESDIQGFVKQVLADVIAATKLDQKLKCFNELGVFRLQKDIWVVLANGIPVGVVEVKKPGKDIMDSETLHGQIYDYMLRLKNFFGQTWVFGIVSTYIEWRIYWLDKCDEIASAADLPAVERKPVDIAALIAKLGRPAERDSVSDYPVIPPSPVQRLVHGTGRLQFDDEKLVPLLISLILKMYRSPVDDLALIDRSRSYIQLTPSCWFWSMLPPSVKVLDINTVPSERCENLLLVQDLRGGAHGRVWLACSSTGKACVIKFAQNKSQV